MAKARITKRNGKISLMQMNGCGSPIRAQELTLQSGWSVHEHEEKVCNLDTYKLKHAMHGIRSRTSARE